MIKNGSLHILYSWVNPALILCLSVLTVDAQMAEEPLHKGKGSVDSSGKFVPVSVTGDVGKKPLSADEALKDLQKYLKLEPLGDGKFVIGGKVVLDQQARTVSIPVKINMLKGIVEYVLVSEQGKVHESIFSTSARPSDVHLACVLLGMKEVGGRDWPDDHTGILPANSVKMEVVWPTNGPMMRVPLAQCVALFDTETGLAGKKTLTAGSWLYSGSHFRSGVFAAESEGSIIAVIGDGAALINGLRIGFSNDKAHTPNSTMLPKIGRTVKMVMTFPQPSKEGKQ